MDEFENTLNIGKFESTNGIWNQLMLNDPWSVGYVTTLIESKIFKSKEDWESFYYSSGEQRNNQLSKLPQDISNKLNDEQLVRIDKPQIERMEWDMKNLNYQFGRTKEQFNIKGNILFKEAQKRNIEISEEECIEAVRYRTVCQTWNGVVIREQRTIALLKQIFPSIIFEKTIGEFDYEFAVDYQLNYKGKLICGIQIKPNSYVVSNAPYVRAAREANRKKNESYIQKYGVRVFDIIFEKGNILNKQVLEEIKNLLT